MNLINLINSLLITVCLIMMIYINYINFIKKTEFTVKGKKIKLTQREYKILLEYLDICKNSKEEE